MKFFGIVLLTAVMAGAVCAQRPRAVTRDTATDATKAVPPAAPQTMKAKYEGGIFGYNKSMEGTLSFDDTNQRLLFRKESKDLFFIPYNAVTSAFADTQKRRPAAATVAQNVPYLGWPLGLIKTKVRYLTLQYSDPDTRVSGVTSFRLDNKDLVDSALFALANKAGMVPRGEVYIKKKDDAEPQQDNQNPPPPSTPGSLMEMIIEVTSFSNTTLDASLFEIPTGFTRVQQNPDQILKQNKP